MKVRARRFGVAVLIYVLGVVAIATASYWLERQRYMEEIDARLFAAASNLPSILPADFHDIARTPDAISKEQDEYNLELLTQHTRSGNLTYIYSYVMHEGMIYFTTCNYTQEDIEKDQVVHYWTSYPEGSIEYFDAMTATEPVYVTAGDRWGLFRTILIPLKSPGGLPYVAAADMDITVIEQSLMKKVISIVGICLLLFILAIPLLLAYRKTYTEMNKKLVGLNNQLQSDINQAMKLEAELKEATQKANTANKIKSQFLANMSHELRTPINGVLGMNQLLMDTPLSPDQREYTKLCSKSANVLLDTINQILDLAAIEDGGLVTKPEPIDSVRFFNDIIEMFSSQIAEKRLDLTLQLDPEMPAEIRVDPVRLRQVVTNLIANAVKFTQKGGVQVALRWREGILHGTVIDSGIGIPEEAQKRVFETFQQVDNSSTRRYGGTGLGLPISQQICRAMEGELQLKHSDNSGSTFVFRVSAPACSSKDIELSTLPVESHVLVYTESYPVWSWLEQELRPRALKCQHVTTLTEAKAAVQNASLIIVDAGVDSSDLSTIHDFINTQSQQLVWLAWPGQQLPDELAENVRILNKPLTRTRLSGLYETVSTVTVAPTLQLSGQILIVDDNAANLKAMGDQIKSTGLNIYMVQNGADAIIACQHHQFDLILMDVQMPVMDGLEATRRIRQTMKDKAPPIVGVSAHVLEENIASAKEAGMESYLCKPITKEALLNKISEYFTK
ncbi:ATP-binding protein [Alkalimarinus sediminis]|uniref:Sensory/regulatory protein RpfC n=1 Tax=Alkalimarinus sediminis TaxID=1632866 RepID=A0A9E8HIA6_9ALTE|nr:ATP-binding protein [Alkalimarinus sediminis]UZW75193.1 response regulator [Alkalimarinus sediminis]